MRAADVETKLDDVDLVAMLERMLLIRAFDSQLPSLYTQGLIRGSAHAAIGQEAVAVGACSALRADDYITSTHRGHGHVIAKGGDVRRMMAELLGRVDGYCRGKGGSMHIADFSIGMLGANGIVGGGFGLAAGAALSIQVRETDQIALCFFGEGAINQGSFHEVANIAAIWKLPLVLLCENNQFAMSGRVSAMTSVADLSRRADAFGFPGRTIDGMNAVAVYESVAEAAARARAGEGPSLLVATCYRFAGHFTGDLMQYRSDQEAAPWLARDPVRLLRERLAEEWILDHARFESLERQAASAVADAIAFAQASPFPDRSEAWSDVYG
jgi:TPP-dependent pyruvate/acetoin dehydrogenase alpha subunit